MRALILGGLFLAACGSTPAAKSDTNPDPAPTDGPIVGNDRDAHGCIGSAGYSWCEHEKACVQPWTLASDKGFDNTAEAFAAYCGQ